MFLSATMMGLKTPESGPNRQVTIAQPAPIRRRYRMGVSGPARMHKAEVFGQRIKAWALVEELLCVRSMATAFAAGW
jgi:hypothetical protein